MKPIPYGRQHITAEDVQAVVEVLKADFLTQGPKISEFEQAFAAYTDARYAVAVSNGTAALHLCAMALGVRPGQKVITSPITFAASANCVRYCGGQVVFADIDPDTYLLDLDAVKTLLEDAPAGTYAGVIPVDFAGRAVNLEAFHELCKQHGLWMIEDACHAPGGSFSKDDGHTSRCGSGEFADLAIFSFHPVKHIASGEGGMITTDDESLYERLLALRSHGIVKDQQTFVSSVEFANGSDSAEGYPQWYMEMQELGYNYRLTDFQAALGLSHLNKAKQGLERRRQIARRYHEAFTDQAFILGQSGVMGTRLPPLRH